MMLHRLLIKMSKLLFFSLIIVIPLYAQSVTLIDENTPIRYLIPDTTVAPTWRTNMNFRDTSWNLGTGGIGFGAAYSQYINIPVENQMYNAGGTSDRSCMIRIKFNVTQEQVSRARKLMLYIRYDDGYVMHLNGRLVSSQNPPSLLRYNSLASGEHNAGAEADVSHLIFNLRFNVYNSAATILNVGENLLTAQGFNISAADPDFLLSFKLVLEMFGDPPSFESSNLPIVFINTNGIDIPEDTRIIADMGIIDNGQEQRNNIADQFNGYDGKVSIEIHGSSSASYPKRSYNIETQDDAGENNNVSLLGLPKENDWILLNFYSDKTLMRDVVMYRLANQMGRYASRSRYCEVVLNGNYNGVYALLEKVKQDKNRVDIADLDADDLQGDSLTGGYIIKLDQPDLTNDYFVSAYPPFTNAFQEIRYLYHYPKDDEIKDEQKNYIKAFIDAFEAAMDSPNYADPDNGYAKYIDVDSFIDYFLLTELCKNVDGYRLSAFFYKDKDSKGGKLHAGPIWDMNFSLGNAGYYGSDSCKGWQLDVLSFGSDIRTDINLPPFWWEKLVREPQFVSRTAERWQFLRSGILASENVNSLIEGIADTLMEAQERNFKLFSGPGDAGTGFWVTPAIFYSFNTYQDETNYLEQWMSERMIWMDQNIALLTGVKENSRDYNPEEFSLHQNYPNPFNPATSVQYAISSTQFVKLKIYDILGNEITTLVNEEKTPGTYTIKFDASGLASGTYFYKLTAGDFVSVKKMMLLK